MASIFLTQLQVVRFQRNMTWWCTFCFQKWSHDKIQKICKFSMVDGRLCTIQFQFFLDHPCMFITKFIL